MSWFLWFMLVMIVTFVLVPSVAYFLRADQRRLEGGESAPDVARLQESVDELTSRVHQLEEEKDFYRELEAPHGTPHNEPESEEEGQ